MFNAPPPDTQAIPPSEGQTENWEQRFKGLQREYNKKQTDFEAASARATDAENTVKELRTQMLEGTKSHQSVVSELQSKITQFEGQVGELTKAKTGLEKDLSVFQGKEQSRQALIKIEASDLIPFVDAGALNITGLEGDALTAQVQMFRGLLASWGKEKTITTLAGSSPSVAAPISAGGSPTKPEDMYDWLMNPANESKPEYDSMYARYLQAVK